MPIAMGAAPFVPAPVYHSGGSYSLAQPSQIGNAIRAFGSLRCSASRGVQRFFATNRPQSTERLLGNHDLNRNDLREAGFATQCSLALCPTDPPLALSHYPLRQIPVGAVNLHGHLHEGTEPSRRHINLAVEQTHYSPVGLIWVLDKARAARRRQLTPRPPPPVRPH